MFIRDRSDKGPKIDPEALFWMEALSEFGGSDVHNELLRYGNSIHYDDRYVERMYAKLNTYREDPGPRDENGFPIKLKKLNERRSLGRK